MNELKSVTFTREITCPECGGLREWLVVTGAGYRQTCPKCHGSGTIEKNVTFELWDYCPDCRYESNPRLRTECNRCQNTHKIRHYITPAEWEKEMVEKLSGDAPVWVYDKSEDAKGWDLMTYGTAVINNIMIIVLAIQRQPAPADDWRPE